MSEIRYLYSVFLGTVIGLILGLLGLALGMFLALFFIRAGWYVASTITVMVTALASTTTGFVLGFREGWLNYARHKRHVRRTIKELASWVIG